MKVCLDSRLIKKGEYFIPVKGDSFDGHTFIPQVLKNGAEGIIEEEELYKIASEKLEKKNPIIIGVAGSVGKTTFRSYLVQILSSKYKVLDGYLNTKLGLSTIIVNELNSQEIIVAELGIDRIGEMKIVTEFLNPTFSIITKLEKEHLQFLKDLKTVVSENLICIKNSTEEFGYINFSDKKIVKDGIKNFKINYFPNRNLKLEKILENYDFPPHDKNYLNCIYEIVTKRFGYSIKEFQDSLKKIKKPKGRLNLLKGKNNSLILDDSYNAVCDTSVIEGIKFAEELCKKYKKELTIILSPIRETGDTLVLQHKEVADFLNKTKFKKLILVGETGVFYEKFLKCEFTKYETSVLVQLTPSSKDLFYIKGSQFYRMEKCVENLMQNQKQGKDLLVRQDARWN